MAAHAPREDRAYHHSWPWKAWRRASEAIDRRVGWDHLWTPLGLATLIGLRDTLRRENLFDPSTVVPSLPQDPLPPPSPDDLTRRTVDGTYNDLGSPRMGMAGTRFGRNVPLDAVRTPTRTEILEPSPREISRSLMTRRNDTMIEAPGVNALVSAWLQFMVRDWFSHGPSPKDNPWEIEVLPGDPWPQPTVTVMRMMDDPTRPESANERHLIPTFVNTCTHWWDASQLYGTTPEYQGMVRLRTDGKLRVDPDGTLPMPTGEGGPTTEPGFWVGLLMLQTLFTREHNAVCDMLRSSYPSWSDEELFQRARLIVAALIAKIHTVEWTPSVIGHPITKIAMRANWFGLEGEHVQRVFGRVSGSEALSGIPGSTTQHYGIPYALTEEFTAVYRMHPLMPDYFDIRSSATNQSYGRYSLRDLSGQGAADIALKVPMGDLLYTLGTQQPGVVTLRNFPRFLQEFVRPDNGELMDLAATDILRHREMGIPRYCEFRRSLHLKAPATFEELTDDAEAASEMRRIYGGDVEKVDLMVGLFAEKRPTGFAFSDSAFRIFIVMASRRLNSDRFFTKDFTPAVYTPEGMEWLADNTFASVLLRHYPELRPALREATNAFSSWTVSDSTVAQ